MNIDICLIILTIIFLSIATSKDGGKVGGCMRAKKPTTPKPTIPPKKR